MDMAPYERLGGSYNVQSKRGCPKRCIYCTYNSSLEGHRLRMRDPREVVDEIEQAVLKYRPRTVEFVDSVFNDPPEHARALLEEIIRRPWKADFTAMGVHPRHLDRELLDLMWRGRLPLVHDHARVRFGHDAQQLPQGLLPRRRDSRGRGAGSDRLLSLVVFPAGRAGRDPRHAPGVARLLSPIPAGAAGAARRNVAQIFFGVRLYPGTDLWRSAVDEGVIAPDADPTRVAVVRVA